MDLLGIFGTIGGVGGLVWIGEKLRRLYLRPNLHVCYSATETGRLYSTKRPINLRGEPAAIIIRDMRWYHLQVQNKGRGIAPGCRGTVELLEVKRTGEWQRHEAFSTRIPLEWAHSDGQQERDIEPIVQPPWDRLDLLTVESGASNFQVVTPLASGRGVRTKFSVEEEYRLTVSVEDRDSRSSAEVHVFVQPAHDGEGTEKVPIRVSGQPEC